MPGFLPGQRPQDFEAFLAFFSARFSFRVFSAFFLVSFLASVVLAMVGSWWVGDQDSVQIAAMTRTTKRAEHRVVGRASVDEHRGVTVPHEHSETLPYIEHAHAWQWIARRQGADPEAGCNQRERHRGPSKLRAEAQAFVVRALQGPSQDDRGRVPRDTKCQRSGYRCGCDRYASDSVNDRDERGRQERAGGTDDLRDRWEPSQRCAHCGYEH